MVAWSFVQAMTSGHGLDLTFHNGIFRGMAGFAIGVGLSMLYRTMMARGWGNLPEGLFTLAQTAVPEPGTVTLLPGLTGEFGLPEKHTEGVRRAALAKWITDPNNQYVETNQFGELNNVIEVE